MYASINLKSAGKKIKHSKFLELLNTFSFDVHVLPLTLYGCRCLQIRRFL